MARRGAARHPISRGHFFGPRRSDAHSKPVSGPAPVREVEDVLENMTTLIIGEWGWEEEQLRAEGKSLVWAASQWGFSRAFHKVMPTLGPHQVASTSSACAPAQVSVDGRK